MIEIAICAMQEGLAANGETAPEGSWDPPREPIPDVGELAKEMEARIEAEEATEKAAVEGESVTTDVDDPVHEATLDEPETAADVDSTPAETTEGADAPASRPGGVTEGA